MLDRIWPHYFIWHWTIEATMKKDFQYRMAWSPLDHIVSKYIHSRNMIPKMTRNVSNKRNITLNCINRTRIVVCYMGVMSIGNRNTRIVLTCTFIKRYILIILIKHIQRYKSYVPCPQAMHYVVIHNRPMHPREQWIVVDGTGLLCRWHDMTSGCILATRDIYHYNLLKQPWSGGFLVAHGQ